MDASADVVRSPEGDGTPEGVEPGSLQETLNWVRLSQRFPVRIVLEGGGAAFPFRMVATAVVTIKGDR